MVVKFSDLLLGGGSIFKDVGVFNNPLTLFRELGTVPFRERILMNVGALIKSYVDGGKNVNVLFIGYSGTGKTALAKFVLDAVERMKDINKKFKKVKTFYVNARIVEGREAKIAYQLTSYYRKVPRRGLSTEEYLTAFFDSARAGGDLPIVVLDEVDVMVRRSGCDLMYSLIRADIPTFTIFISNYMELEDLLDSGVRSSLGQKLLFEPYNADELTQILKLYAERGLNEGTYDEGILNFIAGISAKEHGDARKAIDILYTAAVIAETRGMKKIEEALVLEAVKNLEEKAISEIVEALPHHVKLVLQACLQLKIEGKKPITSSMVYDKYVKIATERGLNPLTYRSVFKIIDDLSIAGILTCEVKSMGRYGRSKIIHIPYPTETLINKLRT